MTKSANVTVEITKDFIFKRIFLYFKESAYVGSKVEGLTIIDLMTQFTSDQTVRHMAGGFHNHC